MSLTPKCWILAVAVVSFACGSETPPPPPAVAAAPAPAPAPEPTPAEVPPAPAGRVFLAASDTGLTPIACHAADGGFRSGDACMSLAPTGTKVVLESGQQTTVTGTGPATCREGQAVVVDAPRDQLRGYASIPAAAQFVESVPPMTRAEAVLATPAPLRQALETAIVSDGPLKPAVAKKMVVEQVAKIDVDGDGTPETLVALSAPGFAGLYLIAGTAAPRRLHGRVGSEFHYTVLGALDLDGDGLPELWLNSYDEDGFAWSVEQLGPDGLTDLGQWRCDV